MIYWWFVIIGLACMMGLLFGLKLRQLLEITEEISKEDDIKWMKE